jgi:hypothetical protein
MSYDFTIFFTFVCNGEIRRKYMEVALKTLFNTIDTHSVPVIVVDASSKGEAKKNHQLFHNLKNLEYIYDDEVNPFTRCSKYLHLIKTKFVLRLLEDCAYINLAKDNFFYIKHDISLMNRNKEINVIQYPIIDEQKFIVKGNTVYYLSTRFEDKVLLNDDGYVYYDRSQERKIYHYLCNNILYRTNFFLKHWKYIASKYENHSGAESGDISNRFYKLLLKIKYLSSVARLVVRLIEKTVYSKSIINNIIVTEAMLEADVVHIGYESTEANINSNSVREVNSSQEGSISTLSNLRVFNDINLLNNIRFERVKSL